MSSQPGDMRPIAAAVLGACSLSAGVIAAGGGTLAILVSAVLGAVGVGGLVRVTIAPWRGSSRTAWIPSAVLIVVGLVAIVVGVTLRYR